MVSNFIKCIGQELNKRWASIDRHIADTGFRIRVSSSLIGYNDIQISIDLKTQADSCLQYKYGHIDLVKVF